MRRLADVHPAGPQLAKLRCGLLQDGVANRERGLRRNGELPEHHPNDNPRVNERGPMPARSIRGKVRVRHARRERVSTPPRRPLLHDRQHRTIFRTHAALLQEARLRLPTRRAGARREVLVDRRRRLAYDETLKADCDDIAAPSLAARSRRLHRRQPRRPEPRFRTSTSCRLRRRRAPPGSPRSSIDIEEVTEHESAPTSRSRNHRRSSSIFRRRPVRLFGVLYTVRIDNGAAFMSRSRGPDDRLISLSGAAAGATLVPNDAVRNPAGARGSVRSPDDVFPPAAHFTVDDPEIAPDDGPATWRSGSAHWRYRSRQPQDPANRRRTRRPRRDFRRRRRKC